MTAATMPSTAAPPVLSCQRLTKVFGVREKEALALMNDGVSRAEILRRTGATVAVRDVSFEVNDGEIFVVMGLSGSGKSTMVRMLNRLIEPTAGSVTVSGNDLSEVGHRELRELRNRKVSMVFQHFALFPHQTVRQNAAYGLKVRRASEQEQRERAEWALETVGLLERADAHPRELSGGMQQRVGLARALATDSDVMLMDEPFSALDPLIRREMQDLLIRLQGELHKTIVFITHDLNEAMRLGDRILLLKDGVMVQCGTGPEIISTPADDYVAAFVSGVDRSRVLTAGDVMRDPRVTARLGEQAEAVLQKMAGTEANGLYVLDADGCIAGVARDDAVAHAMQNGAATIARSLLVEDFVTTQAHRPLIDLVQLVGRHVVPLAVLDEKSHLVGVVPRAALLDALVRNGV